MKPRTNSLSQDCEEQALRLNQAKIAACDQTPRVFHLMGSEFSFFNEAKCQDAEEAYNAQIQKCRYEARLKRS